MPLTLTLAALAAGNILFTLLLQWYVLTHLGVGVQTDALFAGMALPQLILGVVSASLAYVLVPLLTTGDAETFRRDAWAFFGGTTGLFALIACALFLAAGYWVPLLVPGFSPAGRDLTTRLTRIQLLSMVFTASVSVLWAVYRARRKFIWVELSALISNAIAFLILTQTIGSYGVTAAAWAMVARSGLQIIWLLPGLGRFSWPSRKVESSAGEAWRRLRPLILGTAYYKTDPLVDRFLTSMSAAGGLSLLYVGGQLYGAANLIVEKAIAAPAATMLALASHRDDWRSFRRIYYQRLAWVGALTLAGFLVFITGGEYILALLIGHGGITADNVHTLWLIMIALGGTLIAGAMGLITSTTFYAMGNTRTPTRMTVITYSVYIPAKIIVFLRFGLLGLAVVTSVYYFLNLILQIVILEKYSLPRR